MSDQLSREAIDEAYGDANRDRRTYHSQCLSLVHLLLRQDEWRLVAANPRIVEPGAFGLPQPDLASVPHGLEAGAVFASRDGAGTLYFFFDDQERSVLEASAREIKRLDAGKYRQLAVLILPSRTRMREWRAVSRAAWWPRGFFVAVDELRARCARMVPDAYRRLFPARPRDIGRADRQAKIATFTAEVNSNIQVGGTDAPFYKMRFEAPGLTGIVPGQFVMLDTAGRRPQEGARPVPWREFTTSFASAPRTFLKRPFGIHRAFYPGFDARDYLRRMALPRSLAAVMHTVLPSAFEVFYKVLENGKGTREMRDIAPGARIEMIGPLGRRFDIRRMLDEGIDEVHVIGGGVGMAPLIFLVHALRYLGVRVKAFVGVETVGVLKYREDAHIYVDDLVDAGVERGDIFVSCDKASDIGKLVPRCNYATGFVSEQYGRFLLGQPGQDGLVAFACGPTPMMKAVDEITRPRAVRLYVLMEKRMACGIGVCLSCVCRTTSAGSGYSRVCKDGPVFDANQIVWS